MKVGESNWLPQKNYFQKTQPYLSQDSVFICLFESVPKKIRPLICYSDFISLEVSLYLYTSIIQSCLEFLCYTWTGTPSCHLDILEKLQKKVSWTVGPIFVASFESFASCQNVVKLIIYAKSSILDIWLSSEYVPASFFPQTFYILLGKGASQGKKWKNCGINFCKCLVKLCWTDYHFYQKKYLYNLFK